MQPVNGVDQTHEAATISSPPTEHSEDLPQLPEDLKVKLKEPLPREAVSPNPQKPGLSGIKVIYVVERLNDVFGLNGWHIDNEIVETGRMVVVRATLTIPKYSIAIEQFGGNDNPDRGDAYKGACTDALSKCASYLGIGMDVHPRRQRCSPERLEVHGVTARPEASIDAEPHSEPERRAHRPHESEHGCTLHQHAERLGSA